HGFARDGVKASRADVVAKRVPRFDDVRFGRLGERMEGRIADEPFFVLWQHAIDLRLLEHHLRDEDAIRVAGFAPGQVASVLAVPTEEAAAKPLAKRRRRQRQALLASRHGAIIGDPSDLRPSPVEEKSPVPLYTKTGDS